MQKLVLKSDSDIKLMTEGGKRMCEIKSKLWEKVKVGVAAFDVEKEANRLIKKAGGEASFKMVPKYKWATCVNVNEGVVHGIPHKSVVFKKNDVVSVDVGLYYKGFHTDTSFSKYLGIDPKMKKFLRVGKESLLAGISEFREGNVVGDISEAMEIELRENGYSPISSLTGHGIGKSLHEDPRVPCTTLGSRDEEVDLVEGMVLAIEVMYTKGADDIRVEDDGWTISTKDAKISALWEETVALTSRGRVVLTAHKSKHGARQAQ